MIWKGIVGAKVDVGPVMFSLTSDMSLCLLLLISFKRNSVK